MSQVSELVWENLKLSTVGKDSERKILFEDACGSIGPASMVALMGPSGAGKTTFMNILAGRISQDQNLDLRGEIFLNSHSRNEQTWPKLVGYMEHEFQAYEYQTVLETLTFASRTKVGIEINGIKTADCVCDVLKLLGLANMGNTYLAKLSCGERKRVALAVELVGDPHILFCDEPTSGLDIFNAMKILSILKNISRAGKTVLVTIHQPSYEMLSFFDKMILVSMGRIMYSGDIEGCAEFFERCGYPIPKLTNLADFVVTTVSQKHQDEEHNSRTISHIIKEWHKSKPKPIMRLTDEIIPVARRTKSSSDFLLLVTRNLLNHIRNTRYLHIKLYQKMFFTCVFGLTHFRIGRSIADIHTFVGAITFIITNALFGTCGPIFNTFPEEEKIISREIRSGMYSGVTAFLSKYISEILFNFMFELPYIITVYFLIGLNSEVIIFSIFVITVLSLALFSIAYSLAIGTIVSSQRSAQVLGSIGLLLCVIYSGSFNNPEKIPGMLKLLVHISPMYHAMRAAYQSQLLGTVFCDGNRVITGEDILFDRGFGGKKIWQSIFFLWKAAAVWIGIGSVCLFCKTRGGI